MKKSVLFLASLLFLSCSEEKEHRYLVVHHNYSDTTEVVAKYWRTNTVSKLDRYKNDSIKSITEFTSSYGSSLIYNVDCIIAKGSFNNK